MDWAFAVFNWVFVKFILGSTTLSLYFLYNIIYFDWPLTLWKTVGYSRKRYV